MFGTLDPRDQKIAALQSENEDLSESLSNEQQLRAAAEQRAAMMVKMRDPSQMDAAALNAAATVEDFYARGWDNAAQRKAATQCLIRKLIEDALAGGSPDA